MGANSCKPCRKKKTILSGGSILDRVISQASNQDQCLLYKLANYKKGGELVDAYNQGGQAEVEKLIRDQFGQLMYQEGKGQIINRSEYLRWKFRDHEQVVLPIEASLSRYDPLGKWTDHEACWQMQYRGSLGETLLHVLIICDTKIHTRLARTLIKCFPKLALDVVEGEEYLGASALHLAIAYNNNELVQDLVEAEANVNQRAIGSFFLPRDQQKPRPARHTDYEGLAYLGEYPLAWAACCANESVYNLLLDSGAHPDFQDNFGNMILHMVVVCDKLDMFGYALRHPKLPASNGIVNKAGLTPLTLACKLGRAEVFREMLELSAKEFWRYSNITCSAYTLNALDTLLPDGSTNWNSALFIILNGTKEEHLDMLDGGIIQRLLEEKWKTFARNQFLKRLLILVVHLIFLSLAVYLRPDDPDVLLLEWTDDPTTIARYCCEVGTILGVLSYVIFQQGDEIRNQGLWTFLKQQSNSPPKTIFLISNLLILACIPFRLLHDRNTEEAILLFAVPGSWFLLMFFAGAVRLTGPFVTMIYSMITGDMLTFGIIYTIVLFGFSQSFFFLYKGYAGVNSTLYHSYPSTWMALFQITLGNYDYQELGSTTYPAVAKSVFAIFMVFVPILLLNMLIAMMGNTYAHVIEQSEKEWMKQWAKIVITLERAIPQSDAHHYLEEYSISLGPSEDPNTEQRGVMVIKSKNKTRAKQRKGAVANWKRVGKVTMNALKKKGISGEEMRCLMWGRESINTPIKIKGPTKDRLQNPQEPDLTGGFGDALTAALDVMAYTHELDINGAAQGLNLANNVKPVETTPLPINQKNNESNTRITGVGKEIGTAMIGALSQLTESQGFTEPIRNIQKQTEFFEVSANQHLNSLVKVEDPLRELVLCSNEKDVDPEKLKFLALSAANLVKEEEAKKNKGQVTKSVKALAGIFTGTENFVKKVEENLKKKYAALEPSDSDGFGETPLLGKISRNRRAKSAHLRNSSAKSKTSDKRKLVIESDSSTTDAIEETQGCENQFNIEKTVDRDQPLSITDFTMVEQELSVTISETLMVQGNGNGTEPQAGNTEPKRKKRAKSSKVNRVGPFTDQRNCRSAKDQLDLERSESPDPLEPWSTKNIANMNKILAWEHDQDSV
ncbi:transient receptor potential cation channel subfamily V iav [Leptinotarsa decemlineata]|uniref:transient receptor potential cation channel subfamily V iav n=1 Tax=Leptinotarsa decemlineata TaxID=7539 RepID=UPI003D30C8F4